MKETIITQNKQILKTYFEDYSFVGSGNFFDVFLDPFENCVFKVFNISSFFKAGLYKSAGFVDEHDFLHALKFTDNLEQFLIDNVFGNSYRYPLFCKQNSNFEFLPKIFELTVIPENFTLVIKTEFLQPADKASACFAKELILKEPFFSTLSGNFDLVRKLDTATENFMFRGDQIVLNDIIAS